MALADEQDQRPRSMRDYVPTTPQSRGNDPPGPGLMSFQKVKLPSAPNLYSSVPPFGLLALNHSALLNVDSGV